MLFYMVGSSDSGNRIIDIGQDICEPQYIQACDRWVDTGARHMALYQSN